MKIYLSLILILVVNNCEHPQPINNNDKLQTKIYQEKNLTLCEKKIKQCFKSQQISKECNWKELNNRFF